MATNYESQKGFYENVKLDENGYLLVTGISGGGGATGPAGTSGTSGVDGTSGTSGVNGTDGTSGVNGTSGSSGVSPEGGTQVLDIINTSTIISLSLGATGGSSGNQIVIGNRAKSLGDGSGGGNISIGTDAIGNGIDNIYPSRSSISIGALSVSGISGISIGPEANSNALGSTAIAIGVDCDATGAAGTAIQRGAVASGDFSTAIGYNAVASGLNAQAFGLFTTATHAKSVVLGPEMNSVVANHTHVKSLHIATASVYADNTAALAGGLVAGQVYRTESGVLMITY